MMKHDIWKQISITHKITFIVCILCGISVFGMSLSLYISENIQGNTHIVNQIGSIRMQTYRLLSSINNEHKYHEVIKVIDNQLTHTSFIKNINKNDLSKEYHDAITFWQGQLKSIYISGNKDLHKADTQSRQFILTLNKIISKIDTNTENNINKLRSLQLFFISIIVLFTYLAIVSLRKRLFKPWKELLTISKSIQKGNFNRKFSTNNYKDEMNQLGMSINSMSDSLKSMYGNLESLVYEKTEALKRQNDYLDFLYRSCKTFNNERYSCELMSPLVTELMSLTRVRKINIFILDSQESDHVQNFQFGSKNRPHFCKKLSCNLCFDKDNIDVSNLTDKTITLNDSNQNYGHIEFFVQEDLSSSPEEEQLIIAFCDLLTQSLSIYYKEQQQQQLLLQKERNTIARELHDSIAQSLSCLKIKISILQMSNKNFHQEQNEIIQEMRNEVNVAYFQLRELLTTFRLKIDGLGFVPALENTIKEYNKKLNLSINFNYHVPANTIAIHQSIHLLQIIREVFNNIYKHAYATKVDITLELVNYEISLIICDNGQGFSSYEDNSHYGLKIIGDRTQSLSGKWHIESSPGEGTQFFLTVPIISRELL